MGNNKGIQSLEVGISIIDVFLSEGRPLSFIEVQEITGITKSNLYKYFHSLVKTGMLHRNRTDATYVLGNKLIECGNIALQSLDVVERITPYIEEVSEKTSFTSLLAIWSQGKPIVANISSANYGLHIGTELGASLPLLSSTGKIFSSFYEGKEKEEWEQSEFKSMTDEEREKFLKEKEQTIVDKFAYSVNPLVEYVSSVSVPIFNATKSLIGAITVVGFTPLIEMDKEAETSRFIIEVGEKVSKSFGFKS